MIDLDLMRAELVRDEKCMLQVYDDATGRLVKPGVELLGHPTVGIGRCLDRDGISQAEALFLLDNDIALYVRQLDGFAWYRGLDPTRQRAIVNMRHQLGLAGLLQFRAMIAALEQCDWTGAVAAGLASAWAGQTPARANRVLAMLLQPAAAEAEAEAAPISSKAPRYDATGRLIVTNPANLGSNPANLGPAA